jgi:hypothetical protein
VQAAAGQDELAAGTLEDHVERIDLRLHDRIGEVLEVELEPRVQRAVEPGGQVVARLAAQPAGPAVDDDEDRRAQHGPVALHARNGGRRALGRPGCGALSAHQLPIAADEAGVERRPRSVDG